VDTTVHDAFGRVLQTNYGPAGTEMATFAQYDATTGRVTQTSSMLQTQTTALDVTNLRYNQAGEITAIDDLQNNTTHDTQCFTYDSFQRLTAAWTDTAGITSPTAATPGAVGGCTTGRVQTTTASPITTKTVGGPAPYWQTYTYDQLGDRVGMVSHDTTGNALNDSTQSISYPGTDGTVSATLPDQAAAATTANPTTGTATTTPNYTDAAYSNANAGNTMSRKVTTTGPLATGFTITGGGKRCIDDTSSSVTPGNKVQITTCSGSTAQRWTIGTDGTVKVLGMCLDTASNAIAAGTKVVIDTCSTDATQKWKVTTTGTLVSNANTAVCLTDPAASATTGTQLTIATCGSSGQTWTTPATGATGALPAGQTQTFTYDAEGRTATVATTSGTHTNTSKYLYDAQGDLLEQTAAVDGTDKTRILYLFGGAEQITLNVAAKTWTGLRNVSGPDGTTVTRSSSGTVTYQVANGQGTAVSAIDADTMAVTRRSFDPWGNSRGTKPASWVAPDENQGFLGQPADPTTGLNLLGARNYDPLLGRFLTPDPIFETGDPNQMGGYTYSADNPASGSDPSGLMRAAPDGGGSACDSKCQADIAKADSSTSSGTKKQHHGGCHGFWGCAGHVFKKALPVVEVVVVVVVVVVAVAVVASACAGTVVAAPACILGMAEGAGMLGGMFGADCAAMGCAGAGGFDATEGESPPSGGGGGADAAPKAAAEPAPHDASGSSGGSGDAAAATSAGKDSTADAARQRRSRSQGGRRRCGRRARRTTRRH
jgi:RHS repeat-associated protein